MGTQTDFAAPAGPQSQCDGAPRAAKPSATGGSPHGEHSFVVVANRLPVDVRNVDGTQVLTPSPGGLVAALQPVLEQHSGCWVGWPGTIAESESQGQPADQVTPGVEALEPSLRFGGMMLQPVALDEEDFAHFYEGFSNATLWPLYHDLVVQPHYSATWWQAYERVNQRFARAVAAVAAPGAVVWVQDYQLQLVPGLLRAMRPDLTIGFFLHIPFPPQCLFRQLPWRMEVLSGLMGSDLIGFQLDTCAEHFLSVCEQLLPQYQRLPATAVGKTPAPVGDAVTWLQAPDARRVGVQAYPISIDVAPFLAHTEAHGRQEASASVRQRLGNPETLLLGVDRLDYTKGILQRLLAFEQLLEAGVVDPENTVFMQVATPSRERLEHYQRTRSAVEEAVGRINGRFSSLGRTVVRYHHQSLAKAELMDLYAAADIMVVTPFKDGMNLVAKEYVACHGDASGALVLSEFAGASKQLGQAYQCNPHSVASIRGAITEAMRERLHDPARAAARMTAMHEQVLTHDVHLWASSFLEDLNAALTGGASASTASASYEPSATALPLAKGSTP